MRRVANSISARKFHAISASAAEGAIAVAGLHVDQGADPVVGFGLGREAGNLLLKARRSFRGSAASFGRRECRAWSFSC
jgi:hypothetical protein